MNKNIENTVNASEINDAADLREIWQTVNTPVYRVVDEDGVNVADGQIRRLARNVWLYCDETDGYSIMDQAAADSLLLVPDAVHVNYGWDRNGNVVEL